MKFAKTLEQYLLMRIRRVRGCWLWTGSTFNDGYGSASFKDKTQRAHRASYKVFVGSLSRKEDVHHKCDHILCINPKHLKRVNKATHGRLSANSQKTRCKNGHRFDKNNTYMHNGRRACKACHRLWSRQWYKRNKS